MAKRIRLYLANKVVYIYMVGLLGPTRTLTIHVNGENLSG